MPLRRELRGHAAGGGAAGRYIIDTRPETPPLEHYKAILRKTGSPLSAERIAFRDAHRQDRAFTRLAAEIDATVLNALR